MPDHAHFLFCTGPVPLAQLMRRLLTGYYDLERIAQRAAGICGVEKQEVFSKGRQQKRVRARSLLCYWAVREAGISLRTLARRLGISAPGVGYAVKRGKALVQENQYRLVQ